MAAAASSNETEQSVSLDSTTQKGQSGERLDLSHVKPQENHVLPDTENCTLWRNPKLTLWYFGQAVQGMFPRQWPWSQRNTLLTVFTVLAVVGVHHQGKAGQFDSSNSTRIQSLCNWLQTALLETLFWIGCGFLSTAGLGSGVQTGALFLFPHVCREALAWSKLQDSSAVPRFGDATQTPPPSLASLLWSAAIPGFWSGGGSAIGELVPFILARVIKQAGGDPFAILHVEIPSSPAKTLDKKKTLSTLSTSQSELSIASSTSNIRSMDSSSSSSSSTTASSSTSSSTSSPSRWTPHLLLSNTRDAMHSQLSTNAFWKVFALAVIPNALFDLAGLVCGASSNISLLDFFVATWAAKALVRTPAQTCGLALAVVTIASPQSLSSKTEHSSMVNDAMVSSSSSGMKRFMQTWGRAALDKFVGGNDDSTLQQKDSEAGAVNDDLTSGAVSLVFGFVKVFWTCLTVFMFGYFVVSTIEQVAQHHMRTNPGLQHQRDRVKNPKKDN